MDQGKAAWTQPYYSPYLNRYIISYLRPIYEDGVMVAIIGVDLDFQAFIDRLYAKPSEGEEHGMIILSDATGTVEYSPKKPLGVPLVDKDIHLKDTADKVAEAGQTDNEMLSYTWAGKPSLAGIRTLRNGMNFIDLRQVPKIYNRTHKAFMQMGFGLVAVCILASLLPLYMISRLSERLQLVIEAAKEVGEGNYDVKLHDMHPDDIGELSRNFQAMAEKVAAAQENLTYMSQHDALTGILNRMGLDKEVADWLKAHPASHGALVSLDLDGFKFINDLHGHMAGDEALRTLAKDLIESFGHDQIIGRNGGDEFVVFMKDTEPEQAEKVIKAFSNKVKTFTYDGEIMLSRSPSATRSIRATARRSRASSISRIRRSTPSSSAGATITASTMPRWRTSTARRSASISRPSRRTCRWACSSRRRSRMARSFSSTRRWSRCSNAAISTSSWSSRRDTRRMSSVPATGSA